MFDVLVCLTFLVPFTPPSISLYCDVIVMFSLFSIMCNLHHCQRSINTTITLYSLLLPRPCSHPFTVVLPRHQSSSSQLKIPQYPLSVLHSHYLSSFYLQKVESTSVVLSVRATSEVSFPSRCSAPYPRLPSPPLASPRL